MKLPEERQQKTTCRFLYEGREETESTPEERFNREFFLPLVDTALSSLNDRFTHMECFFALYGFLYSVDNMKKAAQEETLGLSCRNMEIKTEDVDGEDLELETRSRISTPTEMFEYIYTRKTSLIYIPT